MNLATAPWLRKFAEPLHPQVRLVCFPHAGGTANFYRPWRTQFATDLQFEVVQYPGREDRMRETFATDANQIATCVADELAAAKPITTILFGHSMGAILAFETALKLQNCEPKLNMVLIVSSSVAPSAPRGMRKLLDMGSTELREEVHSWGGMPNAVIQNDELWKLIEPRFRADLKAMDSYRPTPGALLRCPLQVVYSPTDRLVNSSEMADWRRFCSGQCSLEQLSGNHISILEAIPPIIDTVASTIRTGLD